MHITFSAAPLWMSITFVCCFPIIVYMLANVVREAAENAGLPTQTTTTLKRTVLIFGAGYLLVVALLSFTGIFQLSMMPPGILLFTSIPLAAFYLLFVNRNKVFNSLLLASSLPSLIRLHVFRLIGCFFLLSWHYNLLPATFALTAGIGDIITAIAAIFLARYAEQKKQVAYPLVLVWNFVGLADMISVVSAAIITTRIAIQHGTMGLSEMALFPYCWIAAFAPATFIYLHIMVIKKIKMERRKVANN